MAGVTSGVGKTTVATGVMAALRSRGHRVHGAKVGPDFIDPGYHQVATGAPSYSIDPVLTGRAGAASSLARASQGADIVVIEGVMGLYDGTELPPLLTEGPLPVTRSPRGSTAALAAMFQLPVILVVDARGTSHSIAATIEGFRGYDPDVGVVGVIINRVRSDYHEALVRSACGAIDAPVIGVLRDGVMPERPTRHLGLYTAEEEPQAALRWSQQLSSVVTSALDLASIVNLASVPRHLSIEQEMVPSVPGGRVALSSGPSASFVYPENLERLREAGMEIVRFDPRSETIPPRTNLVWLAGGYPELYLEEIAANHTLLDALTVWNQNKRPMIAECGGHLLLGTALNKEPLAGVHPGIGTVGSRLHLGYRHVRSLEPTLAGLGTSWTTVHEHHYSQVTPAGTGFRWRSATDGGSQGFVKPWLISSYFHWHLGAVPQWAHTLARLLASDTNLPE
ncbi:MAG: cobyrinate a,c-diamide synthase [Ferrimicrobium sp.]